MEIKVSALMAELKGTSTADFVREKSMGMTTVDTDWLVSEAVKTQQYFTIKSNIQSVLSRMSKKTHKTKILSQNGKWSGYHGTIGTPTNMFDYAGNRLYVGDVVAALAKDEDGKPCDIPCIAFVVEENPAIANWTGKSHQFVMGFSGTMNNDSFNRLAEIVPPDEVEFLTEDDPNHDAWYNELYELTAPWLMVKVKSYDTLAVGEKIEFLSMAEVEDI